jgi:oligosaccharide repeat unit polymerase
MLSTTYLILFFTVIFVEIIRKKVNLLDFLTFFHLLFILFYVFPGFSLSKAGESSSNLFLDFQSNLQILIAIYLGYFLILIGFYSTSAIKFTKKIYIKQFSDKTILKISDFLMILAGISILIYSAQYGGFMNAIAQSSAIRAGRVESGSLVLFRNFFEGAEYASYFLASVVIFSRKTKNNLILYLKLILSILLTLMTVLMKSSRASIIKYFIGFALAYIIYKKKIPWITLAVFVMIGLAVILYGDPLFASLSSIPDGYDSFATEFSQRLEAEANESTGNSSGYELVGEFDHPLQSLDTTFNNEYQFRWFSDFIFSFTSLLPSRLIPIETPKNLSNLNTFLSLGHNDWTRPPGLFAVGIYSMSWMGLVIVSFCYGWLGRFLQTVIIKSQNNHAWISFLYVTILNIWSEFINNGDPALVVRGNALFFLIIIFIFSFSPQTSR